MNKFQDLKHEFLDFYLEGNESLKINYMSAYINNIEKLEEQFDKDLKDFNREELKQIPKSNSNNTLKNVGNITTTFVREYRKWCKAKAKEEREEQKRLKKEKKIRQKTELEIRKKEIREKRKINMKKYLEQKMVFMKEYYSDAEEITKNTYTDCYKTHVAPLEIYKGRDLFDFNEDDIREVFISMNTTSLNVKRMLYMFIDNYFAWADSKGMNVTHTNPLQTLDRDELFSLNMKAFKRQFLTLDETYELCEKAIENGSNYQECIVILLARYGIEGKGLEDLLGVKWSDVDAERMKIKLVDEEAGEIRELDIDERLIKWIELAKETTVSTTNVEVLYEDNGYIIKTQYKPTNKSEDIFQPEKRSKIYIRVRNVCNKADTQLVSIKNLVISREFDLIDKVNEMQGYVKATDIQYIHKLFYPNASYSSYYFVLEKYELYRNIEVSSRDCHIDEIIKINEKKKEESEGLGI